MCKITWNPKKSGREVEASQSRSSSRPSSGADHCVKHKAYDQRLLYRGIQFTHPSSSSIEAGTLLIKASGVAPPLLDPPTESPSRLELQTQHSVDGIKRSPKETDERRCATLARD
jgi:hypothetical protein